MIRPFQVYLDSSDFSVLSDPSRRTQEIITLENQLISWRNAGLIEMRFAYSHLIEAAPIEPKYTEVFRCRTQKIAELCQGKALAAQDKIFRAEIRALSGEPVKNGYIFMDDGDWLPELSDDLADLTELLDPAQFKREVEAKGLGRTETRKQLNQFITRNGELRPVAKRFLKQKLPEIVAALCQQYPVDKEEVLKLCHSILNGTSRESARGVLYNSFINLPNFAEWFVRQFDQVNPAVAWLRKTGDLTRSGILESRKILDNLLVSQAESGISNDVILAMAQEAVESLIERLPKTILPELAEQCGCPVPPTMALRELPGKAPSLFTSFSVWGGIMRKTLKPFENERNPKISDMGDVLHSHYLPHVDFFRTDGFAASVIQEIKLPFNTTIVGNLLQLPDAITKKRLAEKGAS